MHPAPKDVVSKTKDNAAGTKNDASETKDNTFGDLLNIDDDPYKTKDHISGEKEYKLGSLMDSEWRLRPEICTRAVAT